MSNLASDNHNDEHIDNNNSDMESIAGDSSTSVDAVMAIVNEPVPQIIGVPVVPEPPDLGLANYLDGPLLLLLPQRGMPVVVPRPNDVCFGFHSHPGTVEWRDAVRVFSDQRDLYPTWNHHYIGTMIRQELAARDAGTVRFLVSLDCQGNRSRRVRDGQWYLATDEEILKKTKERFSDDRKARYRERARNAIGQVVG